MFELRPMKKIAEIQLKLARKADSRLFLSFVEKKGFKSVLANNEI